MHSVTSYAIFWLPAGDHFDTPAIDRPYANASDANYEALVGQYLKDLSNTAYYSIAQQYTDASGGPGIATTFGGSWVDTSQYPNSEGSRANPLQDSDIEAEVTKAISTNGWAAANGNNQFFVFTGENVFGCAGNTCSYGGYCAYHSAFQATDGQNVVYADIPDPGNVDTGSCLATAATGSAAPNGAAFADSAVNLVAHEGFEMVTDPIFNGWYYQDTDHEIADECVWRFGSVATDGSNVVLNGDKYIVQGMWSNKAGGCFLPPKLATLAVEASYQVLGGGSGFTPPTFTYYSAGVLENTLLSTTSQNVNVDFGTTWNVTGTLLGSTANERWQLDQLSSGTFRFAGTLVFAYNHQYRVNFGFSVGGGGSGYSAPLVMFTQFGITVPITATSSTTGPGDWADARSSYSYPSQLPGSNPNERWMAQSVGGSVTSSGPVSLQYYHQYLVPVSYEGGEAGSSPPVLAYASFGKGLDAPLGQSAQGLWIDAGAQYSATNPLSGSTATERWLAPSSSGTVSSATPMVLVYDHQYQLSVVGGFAVSLAPPSPTSDGFYDAGSSVTVSSARSWGATALTREALFSYSLDGGSLQAVAVPTNGSGDFSTPPIAIDGPHEIAFGSTAQYLVSFRFTDALGSRSIIPSTFQIAVSQPNSTVDVQGSSAWLDAGSTFVIEHLVWEGVDVKPSPVITSVDSPQNVTVAAKVYNAALKVTDYLQIPIAGASADIQLANGTSITRSTGPDGIVSMGSIPLGRFNATVSYLGFSQRASADVAAQAKQVDVTLPASLPDIGATVSAVALAALAAYAVFRRRRAS